MKKWIQKLSSSNLIILAAVLLAAYLILILAVTNLGQTRLNESQHRELTLKVQSYASMLEYFFSVSSEEVNDFATSRAMTTFFANLASGMSMEYGLGSSLMKLDHELDKLIETKLINDIPVYKRFILASYDGSVIVDTAESITQHVDTERFDSAADGVHVLHTSYLSRKPHIEIYKTVYFSGRPVAYLIADINISVIIEQLTAQEYEGSRSRMLLSTDSDNILVWNSITDDTLAQSGIIFFEFPIEKTPYQLKGWFSPVNEKDIFTSGWFVAGISFLAVPVIIGLIYTFSINSANIILKTKFEESHKQQRLLSVQNERLVEEIDRRKSSEQKLAYQAMHDVLTGLPNRKYGNEQLELIIADATDTKTAVLVMFIDLDNFKQINDTLGHLAGDFILTDSSQRLSSVIGGSSVLARLGGDEFLLIIPNLSDEEYAQSLSSAILSLFDRPFTWNSQEFFITASIGMAVYPRDGINTHQLLAAADTAMYRVKQDGRNAYRFYDISMTTDVQRTMDLDSRLRQAIKNNRIEMYYQPILDLETKQIVGAEALMRWEDEKLGFIPPDEFILLAEKNGLIHRLGEIAISQACYHAAHWQSIAPIKISINFSSVQFRYCDTLLAQIKKGLKSSGLAANKLDIEVTESLLFNHNDEVVSLLEDLRRQGVELTIDDFGTGYSALSYLQKFPFDKLKIDRSFLIDIDQNASNRELVSAIIAMAKALNIRIVAEGVETKWHTEYLLQRGCDYGQGYYFSKPLPADEFEVLLTHSRMPQSVA
ncbi:EAL domain-containing protein [Photobacterium lutimaris]|uniref:GGDEF-domain containing protein n=1 Tax=Photobacterium lutimaris TaxID=388278 RepID=A0A2T3J0M0_9GAMM|nr:EAL domain-containing protein [Photobacterium lutimaris]PSU34590.1 GGDEF-domain containing protein [Photobacterium lutimaris]TDR71572.1 diguanylate cyclase/phosphodiesterase [Photobacterium lutimaris]